MSTASALQRQQTIEELQDREYDLLVIGGGITGCGIALDAIARGLSVALVEMQDFAAGTSSRSTKLVHGGLRYLKQFEIKEVAELGKERAIVYENGPHVTTPVWMLLPFHKGGTFGKYSTNLGLRVYDFLAGVKRAERRYMLSTGQTIEKEPLVKTKGLLGGGMYVEYRTDDARLTIEVAKAAIERGATLLNYIKAENFLYNEQQKISGIVATDLLTNHAIEIRAKAVVNAAGPWVDDVRTIEGKQAGKHLILSKGVHIVFDESKFPLKQAVYFDTPDGRMVFAIPRQGKTYVGTTDTFYEGDARDMDIYQEDRDYIMNAIRYMFPNVKVTDADIESSWAGVRPLIHEDGKNPSEISRKDEVWISPSGLVTIAGGKLTGYRKMAETVLNTIAQELEQQFGIKSSPCTTKNIPISGGHIGGSSKFYAFLYDHTRVGKKIGLSEEEAKFLTQHYGSNVEIVFNYVKEGHPILPSWLYAQLMYGIHHEMVVHPNDFMVRRTGYMFFQMAIVQQYEEAILDEMAKQLNWTAQQRTQYEEDVKKEIKRATTAL
ncbi:glycerol-3-phosphate dehydrogenase/oxidase [Lysinibacillus sp. FSL M8-0216]|uniref:Glycerol-3-phosphate dehydrogenase n=1 Tax=Lysinibacillus fusiformis TaxID=28031 RepID=A0A1H9P9K7_9BACI|nr:MULTISPECIES: glycerol-3-phosphate dehydrogenase/oxidase [Lysinibacillus]MCG7437022.1 glycerol-3-phosphate dehydrogenase/oxidase [Lysinibacillus fusiformis]MED4671868.1 glycerol-3-phosphate dehydrogenase/oxidase [Lysinibacillus fusiformis]QAS57518.1 glycerol-3-phosphate dehydrogenase/oxidase [Lysinibacillus sphaericus]RDV35795.1 glycerol-3-phosphate dehydrogenase/oxidase [Lysinibacillus fusiformis]SCY70493.1 homodimeric glycerol 3-phosphate dehydrogenase (quinone) [Lysinibacillus fusiformis